MKIRVNIQIRDSDMFPRLAKTARPFGFAQRKLLRG